MGDKIVEIRVQMSSKKSNENRHPNSVILVFILGPLGQKIKRNKEAFFRSGSREAPKLDFGCILESFWGCFGREF